MEDAFGKPKGMLAISIEKKSEDPDSESGEDAAPGFDKAEGEDEGEEEGEYSKSETPEEALEKALREGNAESAMKVLKECGFELKKIEEEDDKESDSGMDIRDRMTQMRQAVAKKLADRG
jgi:hypothetical protein